MIGQTKDSKREKTLSRQAFEAGLKKTVEAYANIGVQLYIVQQVPQQKLGVKDLYYKIYANDVEKVTHSIRELSVSKQQHLQLQAYVSGLFQQHVQTGQLSVVNFDDVFCDDEKCLMGTDKQSYYFDNNHLSTAGGGLVVDALAAHMTKN